MVSLTLRNTVYALRCMALTLMVTMLATMQTMAQDTKSPTCQVTGTIRDKATHEPELAATIIVAKQSQPKVAFKKGVTDTGGVFSLTLPATDARYILTASVLGKKAA
ncbi:MULTISPECIES: carboxypeptidase-like regulatory domain-containing protein [unclassified Prevotella]|nr:MULTISPECIES: carboxypeptidase-like regulatory domain-containing protein [unclassified Prevotella]